MHGVESIRVDEDRLEEIWCIYFEAVKPLQDKSVGNELITGPVTG